MTKGQFNSFDPQWEKTRAALLYLSEDAGHPETPNVYQPGDIAVCVGSIEVAFYQTIMNLGIPLIHQEKMRYRSLTKLPIRFCVINRQIQDQVYEVFLLTTYGGATDFESLDEAARRFSMPMGLTKWQESIPGITTVPNIFGQQTSSFLFAMSTLQQVPPHKVFARVPFSEVERIRRFSIAQKEILLNDDWTIRKSVYERRQGRKLWFGDETFSLTPDKDPKAALGHDDAVNDGPFVKTYTSCLHPQRAMSGIRLPYIHQHDVRWILRYAKYDLLSASRYLSNKPIPKSPFFKLPVPYITNSLRLSSVKLMRLIR